MTRLTVDDLFAKIGKLVMENESLRVENEALVSLVTGKEAENVPSEVPSAVSGPDDDTGLE